LNLLAHRIKARIEPRQAAAAGIDVEPEDPLRRARHAVALRSETVLGRNADELHLAPPGVELAERGALVRDVAGEPDIARVIEPGVVNAPARDHDRARAEGP